MASSDARRRGSNSFAIVLSNRDFRYLWAAGGLDNSGRWMEAVVMALLMLELTDSSFQVALLFVFRWTPMLLMSLLSGMFADRANRWRLIVTARASVWTVMIGLTVLVATGEVLPWHLYLASLVLGWLFVLEFPSRNSFIYDLLGGRQIVGAMSLETITITIGRFIGPFLGGLIVEFGDYSYAFILLSLLYGIALFFTVLIKARVPARSTGPFNFRATAASGLRYAFGNRIIRSLLGFTIIMNALAFSVESLFPVVARDHLGVGEGLTGLLIASQSIGTFVAAVAIGLLSGGAHYGRIFCLGLFVQLLSLVFFALSPWYTLSLVLLLCSGIGMAGFSAMQSTIIMIAARPDMRGTLLGVLGHCIGIAALGGLVVGKMGDVVGAHYAVAISTGLGLFLLVVLIPLSPLVRRPIVPPDEPEAALAGTSSTRESPPL